MGQQPVGQEHAGTISPQEPPFEENDYANWTKAELQSEIDERNEGREEDEVLSRTGAKDHLIAVLEGDDAEDEVG